MTYTTVADAQHDLEVGIKETLEDMPEFSEVDVWGDIVDAIVLECTLPVAREFYRREKGGELPAELARHLR